MSDERLWFRRPRDWRGERDDDGFERDERSGPGFADYRDWRASARERHGPRDDDAGRFERDWRGGEDRYRSERYDRPTGWESRGGDSWRDARDEGGRGRYQGDWRPDWGGRSRPEDAPRRRYGAMSDLYGQGRAPRSYDRDAAFNRHDERAHEGDERNWMEQARDEVASWFGDRDAENRRERDRSMQGEHRGRGPGGYRRSDDKIREDVHDRLTDDSWLDASGVEVAVQDGEVTLTGLVHDKTDKRRAEMIADRVSGAMHVQNLLRVKAPHGVLHTAGSEQASDAAAGSAPYAPGTGPSGGGADSQRVGFGSAATGASTAAGQTRLGGSR